ncbi:MAG: Tim44/TimA family putative adaptor protein, partial [Alphaproteobacteria bacterium]|nr:Tim44/TimA family putative adaptor protein [Alphaproteobacteria bacterium]
REGFEKPPATLPEGSSRRGRRDFDVIEGGPDRDIIDHVEDGSESAKALAAMKMAEPGFNVREFLEGARGAYEMILMAFENGDLDDVRGFLSDDVAETFDEVIQMRIDQGLTVEARFAGVREMTLTNATLDRDSSEADISVKFVGELMSVVKNAEGDVVEGSPDQIKRQKDVWTFSRKMGVDDPNWILVATGE